MQNYTSVRANFAVSLLRKMLRLPVWQRMLIIAFILGIFSVYFTHNHTNLDGGTLAVSILVVVIAAGLLGLGGGISAAFLLACLELYFLGQNYQTNLLGIVSGDFLLNALTLLISGGMVGYMRSLTLQTQRQLEERQKSELALRESELRFRSMADLTYNWEAWQGPDGRMIYTSPSVQRMTGYSPDIFMDNPNMLWQLTLEEDRPALLEHFALTQGQSPIHQIDLRIRRADGKVIWLRHICQPVYDTNGAFQGRRASNLEITEIRQANEELKRRLELEHLISEISSHFIDTPDHDITHNLQASLKRIAEFLDAERSFLVTFQSGSVVVKDLYQWSKNGSTMHHIYIGLDFAQFPWIAAQIRNHQVLTIPSVTNLPIEAGAERDYWKDGDAFSLVAIPLVLENNAIGYFAISTLTSLHVWQEGDIRSLQLLAEIYTNILERQRIQKELVDSERRFRSTFENAGIGTVVLEAGNTITDVNPMICEMFGYTREEVIGRVSDDVTFPEDRSITADLVRELNETRASSAQREIRYLRKDGTPFWGHLTLSMVRDLTGKSLYGIGMIDDVTERRRISEELHNRERILEAVSLAAEDMLRVPDWESSLPRALQALGSASQANRVAIYQLNDDSPETYGMQMSAYWSSDGSLELRDSVWPRMQRIPKLSPFLKTLVKNQVITTREVDIPEVMKQLLDQLNIVEMLIVSIFAEDKIWGFISFDTDHPSVWSIAEKEGLKIAANVFGAAFQRRQIEKQIEQLYQAERDQRQMAEALRDTAETLNASLNLQEVFDQVLSNVEKVVPMDAANIMLIDNGMTRVIGARGYEEHCNPNVIYNVHYRVSEIPNLNTMFKEGRPVITSAVGENRTWVQQPDFDWVRSFAGAPIRQDGKTIGFLNVDSVTPDLFTQVHAERLQVFADQASLAIRNARLFDEARRRAQQIALLNQMAQAAISAATQSEMLDPMVNHLTALFNADSAAILLFDMDGSFPRVAAIVGESTRLKGQLSNAELAGFILMEQPLEIEDLATRPDVKSAAALLHPCRALLALPMILNGSRMGVVLIGFKYTHHFTANEIMLGEQAALQVALGISKNQLLEAERTRTRQLARANGLFTALDHVATRIGAAADSSGVIKTLEIELQQLDLSYAIALADSTTGEMQLQYYSFRTHPEWRNNHSQLASLLDRDEFKHLLKEDPAGIFIPDPMRKIYGLSTSLDPETMRVLIRLAGFDDQTRMFLLPLIVKERSIGLLVVWGSLQESDRNVMSTFASQLALAFHNASLYEEIQRVAITDEMTGLFNRRGMHEFGEREVERARRFERPLTAMMIDLDLFSRVNNTYGHLVGDEVLRLLSERVRTNIRELDVAVRFGGEEFLILLVETSVEDALKVAERIRQSISSAPFETSAGSLRITASIGVAEMTQDMTGITHLIARADQALYTAKQNGRNCVMMG
ncbi:diguanylate cyclase [Longilinea arvoryzae]|nr:diguanylate cyclase [Longilinea arvoryzae]